MHKRLALAALCLFGTQVTTTGCYGGFALTKKVHRWNGTLGNKFLESVVMWALVIIPVYGLCLIGDFFIFNLIEFWAGKNPVASNGGPAEVRTLADGSLELRQGERVYRLVPTAADAFELRDASGPLARGRVTPEGDLVLTRPDGEEVRVPHEALLQARERLPAPVVLAAE